MNGTGGSDSKAFLKSFWASLKIYWPRWMWVHADILILWASINLSHTQLRYHLDVVLQLLFARLPGPVPDCEYYPVRLSLRAVTDLFLPDFSTSKVSEHRLMQGVFHADTSSTQTPRVSVLINPASRLSSGIAGPSLADF